MLLTNNLSLRYGKRILFENVNIKFLKDNCYGLIGANGAGKTTFLKILSGEIESTTGDVVITDNERMSVLKQNHNLYDDYNVIETVIMGNEKLYNIMKEKEEIYSKAEFTEADGIRAGDLEAEFAELNGWQAETDAAILLNGLGVTTNKQNLKMKDLYSEEKVKVLLAQALFGNPDILLLDEPTNYLDINAKIWLENFLLEFKNTVLVVSHDRHFLNKVCTYMLDIDYEKISLFPGNYDFWYESSQLMLKQSKSSNKKKEDQIKELQDFIRRFSANASKSKQATSRKKILEKIELEELKPSSRKYPYINFDIERPLGKEVVEFKGVSKTIGGKKVLNNLNIIFNRNEKIAFVGKNELAKTTFFKLLAGEIEPDEGTIKWGTTVVKSYYPKEHEEYFKTNESLVEWLSKYSTNQEEPFLRGFLGRMLFSGDEALKKINVLSGGEKVRCMFSRMMLTKANVIILDEPTNHLDIEAITSLNNSMVSFDGTIFFSSFDYELLRTVANRVIEFLEDGKYIDKSIPYDEYINQ